MSNLESKVSTSLVKVLALFLYEQKHEYGDDAYPEFYHRELDRFIAKNSLKFDGQELEWFKDAVDLAMDHFYEYGVRAPLPGDFLNKYDNTPPDTRTDAQIHADRLKEFTPSQIADAGLFAFEIMIDSDHAGRFTFDMIWNDDFGGVITTGYQGEHEDPVNELIHEDIDERIHVARHAHSYIRLAEIVREALDNVRGLDDRNEALYLLEQIDKEEEEES